MMSKINYVAGGNDTIPAETAAVHEIAKNETEKSEKVEEPTGQEARQMTRQKDEYISSQNQKPSGLYSVSKDKDGKTVINYEDPNKKQSSQQISPSTINLKSKRDSIKMKLKSETDDSKVRELKKKLKELEKQIKNTGA